MKTEKIILSFIAVLVGLLVAGVVFYFYEGTKIIPQPQQKTIAAITITPTPTPTPKPTIYINIDQPTDQSVTAQKTITISGTTPADATVIINTPASDQVVQPTSSGSFSATVTLADGENEIMITAVAANGQEAQKIITVTSSTENF